MVRMTPAPIRHFISLFFVSLVGVLMALHPQPAIDSFISFLGIGIILVYLVSKKDKDLFDPFYLFSLFYLMLWASALVLYYRGFGNNEFISSTEFYLTEDIVYRRTLVIALVGYLFAFFGYHATVQPDKEWVAMKVPGIDGAVFLAIAIALYLLGFANFLFNVFNLYGGDILGYFKNVSMRQYEFANSGTTLGYHLMYAASYMMFVRALQRGTVDVFVIVLIAVSVAVYASTGRIANTLFYGASFLVIFYYNRGGKDLNFRLFFVGFAFLVAGIGFYLLRYASSLNYIGMYDFEDGVGSFLVDHVGLEGLINFAFDKGNTPNFAILMKVVDSWATDIGNLYGASLLAPFYVFLSPNMYGMIEMPAVLAKQAWYMDVPGGNLPITGVGEMVANFSIYGFALGMLAFGALGGVVMSLRRSFGNNIFLIFYSKFVFFYMLFPKGEFNNLDLFWATFPCVIFYIALYLSRTGDAMAGLARRLGV